MDVSALTGPTPSPRAKYRRRASDMARAAADEPRQALVPTFKGRGDRPSLVNAGRVHSASGFLAQLIACVHDFPQMRQRRRASLNETLTAYQHLDGAERTTPLLSRLV